nr:MAG TPA: hypothetical protein [Microviridae sp.]
MLNPEAMVRYYGLPTERVANDPGSKTAPTWKAVKRANGTTEYIEQPDENTYEKIQRAGEGYDLASAIARLEAGDTSIKAKSMVYTEGTDLENLPKDIMTMHEKAETAAETMKQLEQMQRTEQPKLEEKKEEEKKSDEPKQ